MHRGKNWLEHSAALGGLALIIIVFFRHWLQRGIISSGDWGFFWPETMYDFWPGGQLWDSGFNFGRILDQFFVQFAIMGWMAEVWQKTYALSERFVWFFPLLFFLIIAPYLLVYVITRKKITAFFAGLLYALNTYSLLLAVGGQISVGVAVAIAPLVLLLFIQAERKQKLYYQVAGALILSLQAMYDLRITYVTVLMMGLYVVLDILVFRGPQSISSRIGQVLKNSWFLGVSFVVLQTYWLWPLIQGGGPSLPQGVDDPKWLEQLSFITIHNGLTLFHPLWPLRIHGLIDIPGTFFILNIVLLLAAIFTVRKKIQWYHIYFLAIIVVNLFILKGIQDPYGFWYAWAFHHVPGFVMFRDPSKFYTPIALGMALYFGLFMDHVWHWSRRNAQKLPSANIMRNVFAAAVLLGGVWFVLHQTGPALTKDVQGTFVNKEIPLEYHKLKEFLAGQEEFFRTFWLPQKQRFGFFDNQHPIVNNLEVGEELLAATSSEGVPFLGCNYYTSIITEPVMMLTGAKYLIIPQDTENEFVHKQGQCSRRQIEGILARQNWLKKSSVTKHIKVYENSNYAPRFYATSTPIISYNSRAIVDDLQSLEKETWQRPTILTAADFSIEQKEILENIPAQAIMQYNAEDTGNIVHNRGWESPSNKMDAYAQETPEAVLTYRINIPETGNYLLYANLRHDDNRGTLKYSYNIPDVRGLNPENIASAAVWSEGLQPAPAASTSAGSYYYANRKLGENMLQKGENTLTFRNTAPYAGDQNSAKKYGAMTIDYFWLVRHQDGGPKTPETSWQKISATHYQVKIKNAGQAFWLNFLEDFHPGWQASIHNEVIADEYHFPSNIYAQSWYLQKTGDYTVDIRYGPQEYLEKGMFISTAALIINIILLFVSYVVARNKKISEK